MEEIAIIGASGHAKVIFDIIKKQRKYKVIAFLEVDSKIVQDPMFLFDTPVLSQSFFNLKKISNIAIAIGDNATRSKVYENLKEKYPHLNYPALVHPSAQIGESVLVGSGCVLMANTAVNANTVIEDFCIINTSSSIDHDCLIHRFSSIAPGAILGGNVVIGEFAAIGLGVKIIHGITVGEDSIIGAGAVVIKNMNSQIVAYGTPAKEIQARNREDRWL